MSSWSITDRRRSPAIVVALALAGCHLDMADQPKITPLSVSAFFADSSGARPIPEGTVARGHARTDELLFTGRLNGTLADLFPMPISDSLMQRGRNKFNTFCSPCHGKTGDGTGMIVQRGFPQPRSFHLDSLRREPAGYYYDVITNGFGRMYSYRTSVSVEDRWAIVAYIRALQLSHNVPLANLRPSEKALLSDGRP